MTLSNLPLLFNESELPCSASQLYQKAQSAFTNGNLREAEQDLTDAMDAITNTMSVILLNRAIIRGIQGNIDSGLFDAYKITDMNPTQPEGYLCAGALLRFEGRLTDALRIYNTGVHKLNNDRRATKIKQVEALHQGLADLQSEIGIINSGIFKKLPQEIIANILGWLSYRDKLQCAATCHTWRSHLYNNLTAAMWHNLDFVGNINIEALEIQLARINPSYVRAVSISRSCNALVSRHVLRFLAKCTRVERLELHMDIDEHNGTRGALYRALESNQHSLKWVVAQSGRPWLAIAIVNICSSLVTLEFDSTKFCNIAPRTRVSPQRVGQHNRSDETITIEQQYISGTINNELQVVSYERLETAPVGQPRYYITRLVFTNILLDFFPDSFWQQFPFIEDITIRISFISHLKNLMRSVQLYCPRLKTLDLGPSLHKQQWSGARQSGNTTSVSASTAMVPSTKKQGLVNLNLRVQTMGSFGSNEDLVNILHKSCGTLETLHIRPRIIGSGGRASAVAEQLYLLSHLRVLGFHGATSTDLSDVGIDLGVIVRNCTMLESLIFNNISITDVEMNAISDHAAQLRQFHLVVAHNGVRYTPEAIKNLLRTCNELVDIYLDGAWVLDDEALSIIGANQTRLRSFALCNCFSVTAEGLYAIAAYKPAQLRQLVLYNVPEIQIQQCIDHIVAPLSKEQLRNFTWVGETYSPRNHDQMIASLERITQQRSITFTATSPLKIRILFGTTEQMQLTCIPGNGVFQKRDNVPLTRMLRYF